MSPRDPLAIAAGPVVLIVVAALAISLPTRRAAGSVEVRPVPLNPLATGQRHRRPAIDTGRCLERVAEVLPSLVRAVRYLSRGPLPK